MYCIFDSFSISLQEGTTITELFMQVDELRKEAS